MAKRIAFVALSSRIARAVGLETGEQVLVGDLRDGFSVADLERLLAARAVEIEVLPTPAPVPEAVVKPAPAPFTALEPSRGNTVVVANPAAVEVLARRKAAEKAAEESAAKAEAVKELVDGKTKPQLIKLAKKRKVTFSKRGTKLEIAREIVEAKGA